MIDGTFAHSCGPHRCYGSLHTGVTVCRDLAAQTAGIEKNKRRPLEFIDLRQVWPWRHTYAPSAKRALDVALQSGAHTEERSLSLSLSLVGWTGLSTLFLPQYFTVSGWKSRAERVFVSVELDFLHRVRPGDRSAAQVKLTQLRGNALWRVSKRGWDSDKNLTLSGLRACFNAAFGAIYGPEQPIWLTQQRFLWLYHLVELISVFPNLNDFTANFLTAPAPNLFPFRSFIFALISSDFSEIEPVLTEKTQSSHIYRYAACQVLLLLLLVMDLTLSAITATFNTTISCKVILKRLLLLQLLYTCIS